MIGYDETTALLVVDCQNDFADPEGSLFVTGASDVLAATNRDVVRAVVAGSPVVYTQDWHPPITPHFEKDGGIWPVHCVEDTWGAAFHPSLVVVGPSVRKGVEGGDGYSGFSVRDPESGEEHATELDVMLRSRRVTSVVVVGLALDYCVKETAADAVRLGYETTLVRDATAAVDLQPGDGTAAEATLRDASVQIR